MARARARAGVAGQHAGPARRALACSARLRPDVVPADAPSFALAAAFRADVASVQAALADASLSDFDKAMEEVRSGATGKGAPLESPVEPRCRGFLRVEGGAAVVGVFGSGPAGACGA